MLAVSDLIMSSSSPAAKVLNLTLSYTASYFIVRVLPLWILLGPSLELGMSSLPSFRLFVQELQVEH